MANPLDAEIACTEAEAAYTKIALDIDLSRKKDDLAAWYERCAAVAHTVASTYLQHADTLATVDGVAMADHWCGVQERNLARARALRGKGVIAGQLGFGFEGEQGPDLPGQLPLDFGGHHD